MTYSTDEYRTILANHVGRAHHAFVLDLLGNHLAEECGYAPGVRDREALAVYLSSKHGWLPQDIESMTDDHLEIALHEELQSFSLPEGARTALEALRPLLVSRQ